MRHCIHAQANRAIWDKHASLEGTVWLSLCLMAGSFWVVSPTAMGMNIEQSVKITYMHICCVAYCLHLPGFSNMISTDLVLNMSHSDSLIFMIRSRIPSHRES